MTAVTENIFIGSYKDVNPDYVALYGISCILNMTIEADDVVIPGVENARFPLHDYPQGDIPPVLHSAADKIDEIVKSQGKVLVHCVRGISRSVTACLAYFVKYANLSLRDSYKLVKSRRSVARPHQGFWRCLLGLEESIRGEVSVKLLIYPMGCVPDVYKETGTVHSRVRDSDFIPLM